MVMKPVWKNGKPLWIDVGGVLKPAWAEDPCDCCGCADGMADSYTVTFSYAEYNMINCNALLCSLSAGTVVVTRASCEVPWSANTSMACGLLQVTLSHDGAGNFNLYFVANTTHNCTFTDASAPYSPVGTYATPGCTNWPGGFPLASEIFTSVSVS